MSETTPQVDQPPVPDSVAGEAQGRENWKERYIGMTKVLSERDKQIAALQEQLESLSKALKEKDDLANQERAKWDATRLQWEEQLKQLQSAHEQAQAQLGQLSAYQRKMEALKNFPDLLPLAEAIPAMDDEESMRRYLETLQKTLDDAAAQKAQKLTAGMVPPPTTARTSPQVYPYATHEAWHQALMKAAGTPEFAELSSAYKRWAETQS